jgi:hypothetical protein
MSGQLDSLGQIMGGPLLGTIGDISLRAALAVTALTLAPALALYVQASAMAARLHATGAAPNASG